MPRTKKDEYVVSGVRRLDVGDKAEWDGTSGISNQGCSNCDKPHEVEIVMTDFHDPSASYRITSDVRRTCCGDLWVVASNLSIQPPVPLPPALAALEILRDKVRAQDITYANLIKAVEGVFSSLENEFRVNGSAVLTGVCSGCYSDIKVVGGEVLHDDGNKTCQTPAILLAK